MLKYAKKLLDGAVSNPQESIQTANDIADFLSRFTSSEQQARSFLVDKIKCSEHLSPLEKAAMISEHKKILREFKNKSDIVQKALLTLGPHSEEKINFLDEEWVSRFLDCAKHVSQREVQTVWAKILANEIEQPGAVPKALIHTLSYLDRQTAQDFERLCSFVVLFPESGDLLPIIDLSDDTGLLQENNIYLTTIDNLVASGMISVSVISYQFADLTQAPFIYGGHPYLYQSTIDPPSGLPLGIVNFTKIGLALYQALEIKALPGFQHYFDAFARRHCCVVQPLSTSE